MEQERHRPSSQPLPLALTQAIQLAIQEIIIEGTRHAVDLKASEKLIERGELLLQQDPSNQTLLTEQTRKLASRDACVNQIEALSIRIAQRLEEVFVQNISEALKPTAGDLNLKAQKTAVQDAVNTTERLNILEKQFRKNEEEHERSLHEQQLAIRALEQKIAVLDDNNRIRAGSLSPANLLIPNEDIIAHENNPNACDESRIALTISDSGAQKASENLSTQNDIANLKRDQCDLRRQIMSLSQEVNQQRLHFTTILSKEIPVNLKRSVLLMQQDVDSAVHTAITKGINQTNALVRELVVDFENRIASLERITIRLTSTDSKTADILLLRKSSPAPAPLQPQTKDPRLLRRQSVVSSSEPKTQALNDVEKCNQQ